MGLISKLNAYTLVWIEFSYFFGEGVDPTLFFFFKNFFIVIYFDYEGLNKLFASS